MTSPEVIFTICRRTTASPCHILKSLITVQGYGVKAITWRKAEKTGDATIISGHLIYPRKRETTEQIEDEVSKHNSDMHIAMRIVIRGHTKY